MDNLYDIDLNLYKIFLSVAKNKSFSKAAEELFVTQPAISHAISNLEKKLKTKLFIRKYNETLLTQEGRILISHIKKAYTNISVGEKLIRDSQDLLFGDIEIGVPTHIGTPLIIPKIREFHYKYPNIKFYITSKSTNTMIKMLEDNSLDFIIDSFPIKNNSKISIINLEELETCFVSSSKVNEIITEENYNKFDFILPNKNTSNRLMLDRILSSRNINISPIIESYSTEMAIQFVKEKFGIAWLSKELLKQELKTKNLFEVPSNINLPKIQIQLAYIDDFISFPARKFINTYFIKN